MRFICLTALLLTGCGMKEGFEKGFDKSFAQSCRTAAMKNGADQKSADQYCDCALVKYKETKSMDKAAEICEAQTKSAPN